MFYFMLVVEIGKLTCIVDNSLECLMVRRKLPE